MASDGLAVILEGKPIGNIERLASGALRLRYDESYRHNEHGGKSFMFLTS